MRGKIDRLIIRAALLAPFTIFAINVLGQELPDTINLNKDHPELEDIRSAQVYIKGSSSIDDSIYFPFSQIQRSTVEIPHLEYSVFRKSFIIGKSRFPKKVNIGFSHFNDDFFTLNTQFDDSVSFEGSVIDWGILGNTRFSTFASFASVTSSKGLAFYKDSFTNAVTFEALQLEDDAHLTFDDCVLPDTLIFGFAKVSNGFINLENANFSDSSRIDISTGYYQEDRKHVINLFGADISKIHLDYLHFKLDLYNRERHAPLLPDEIETQYESLLKNFKDRGQLVSYELLDMEYRDFKWSHQSFWWFGRFLRFWNRYGYHNELPLLWTGMLLGLFTLLTMLFLPYLNGKVYTQTNIPSGAGDDRKLNVFRRLIDRIWYSFMYTVQIFFPLSMRFNQINTRRVFGTLYILLMYSAGLLCVGYIANFIFQK